MNAILVALKLCPIKKYTVAQAAFVWRLFAQVIEFFLQILLVAIYISRHPFDIYKRHLLLPALFYAIHYACVVEALLSGMLELAMCWFRISRLSKLLTRA
jgi:hypothetical protein